MPLSVMRGSTIQNLASSTSSPAALFAIFAVTPTLVKSPESRTAVTWPMSTSLYLMRVLPASMPATDVNVITIVGPSVRMRWTAVPRATAEARTGMIPTTDTRVRWCRGTTVACGRSSRSVLSGMPALLRIPDQARIERLRGDHGQHDDRGEEYYPRARLDRHQRGELHQCHREGVDEDVQHRPAADEAHHPVEPRAVAVAVGAPHAPLHGDEEVGERDQLAEGHHHARDQHDERERPRAGGVQVHRPAHDGVGVGGPGRVRGQHRQN